MATKTYLRVGAYYQSETGKSLTSDLEITDIVDNTNPTDPVVDDEAIFPDQTGNAGKFLKTNGSILSWDNAGGGGGTPTLDEVLAEGSTLTEDRTIDLDGHILHVAQGGNDMLQLDPVAFNAVIGANDGTGNADFTATADVTGGTVRVRLNANNGVNNLRITADAEEDTIEYQAGTHFFSGDVVLSDMEGGGVTGASIDDTGKLIRTSGLGYLVYTALLSQSGTDAPTAVVLANTLGGTVVWAYEDVGYYTATLAGAFPSNKPICFITPSSQNNSLAVDVEDSVPNKIAVYSTVDGVATDGRLFKSSIEIRVYPA